MNATARRKDAEPSVLSLAQLLEQQPPTAPPCLVEPGLLRPQGCGSSAPGPCPVILQHPVPWTGSICAPVLQ